MPNPHSLSPAAQLELLQLHAERKLTLTLACFEEYFDNVLSILEKVNDEKFRATEEP